MAPGGRRPGASETRQAILTAARQAFTEQGYEQASLRGIARRAGVDPALVHHYFAGKPELFVEVLHLGGDPRGVVEKVASATHDRGAVLVHAFLQLWEHRPAGQPSPFVSLVQAVAASPEAADGLREFLAERVWSTAADGGDPQAVALTQGLVSSILFGIAWDRYVLRLEPMASATLADIARWVGPLVDQAIAPKPAARRATPARAARTARSAPTPPRERPAAGR